MRIPLAIEQLKNLLNESEKMPDIALLAIGTAEFLLDFLVKTAMANNIDDLKDLKINVRAVRTAFYKAAGLLKKEDMPNDSGLPALNAVSAILLKNQALADKCVDRHGKPISD